MPSSEIKELDPLEIDQVDGGIIPLIVGAVALVSLMVVAFNSGYTVGKDIAENEKSQ